MRRRRMSARRKPRTLFGCFWKRWFPRAVATGVTLKGMESGAKPRPPRYYQDPPTAIFLPFSGLRRQRIPRFWFWSLSEIPQGCTMGEPSLHRWQGRFSTIFFRIWELFRKRQEKKQGQRRFRNNFQLPDTPKRRIIQIYIVFWRKKK